MIRCCRPRLRRRLSPYLRGRSWTRGCPLSLPHHPLRSLSSSCWVASHLQIVLWSALSSCLTFQSIHYRPFDPCFHLSFQMTGFCLFELICFLCSSQTYFLAYHFCLSLIEICLFCFPIFCQSLPIIFYFEHFFAYLYCLAYALAYLYPFGLYPSFRYDFLGCWNVFLLYFHRILFSFVINFINRTVLKSKVRIFRMRKNLLSFIKLKWFHLYFPLN